MKRSQWENAISIYENSYAKVIPAKSVANVTTRILEIFASIVLAAIAVASTPVHAAVVLDQDYEFTSGVAVGASGTSSEVGQTFTVGMAGTLDHIDVLMFRQSGIFDPATDPILNVYNASGGLPIGASIATTSVSKDLVPYNLAGFVSFDISGSAIPVLVGDVLAFSISTSGSALYWLLEKSDTGQPVDYASGQGVSRILNIPPDPWQADTTVDGDTVDRGFRTYVEAVASPASVWLFGSGLLGVVGIARRKKTF